MANDVSPQLVINYISQRKKILVGRNNQPISQMIKFDYNLTDTFNFQVINKINQIVDLGGKTYEIFGSYIDNKQQLHILFYTDSFRLNDNVLSFTVNTYTSEYMAYVKTQREIDLSIVSRSGNDTAMVLRDNALAYPRPYIEGQTPAEIVYRNIMSINVPVSGQFGAGSDLDLASDVQSFAFGEGLVTNDENQFVIGQYNTPDAEKVFIIGNGEDNYNRSNLFTIDEDGNVSTVGTISANTVYINGQELSATIDDKVNALSGETDDKFTATSAWVNDTFEPIATATEKYNNLTGDVDYLSTAIDQLSLETGNEFNSTSAWINETFETIANVAAKESALNDKIDALSTASDEKFELKTDATSKYNTLTSQISDLNTATNNQFTATSGWANGKFETITNVATKETALNNRIDALSTATDLKFTSTSGWANETFETKSNASQKYDQLSAAIHAVTTGGIADLTQSVTAISGDLETVSGAVQTNADNIATISNELDGVEQDVETISGKVDTNTENISTLSTDLGTVSGDVITNKGLLDEVSGIATTNQTNIETLSTDLETLSGEVQTNTTDISTISGKLDDYELATDATEKYNTLTGNIDAISTAIDSITEDYATDEDIEVVSGAVDTNTENISTISGKLDDFATVELLSTTSGALDEAIGLVDDKADANKGLIDTVSGDLDTAEADIEYISSFVSGLPEDIAAKADATDVEYISSFVSGLPDDIALKANQTDVDYVSSAVTGVVEDIGYLSSVITGKADSSAIPTSIMDLTNDSEFATSAQVSAIVEGYNYITIDDVPPGTLYSAGEGLATSGESNNIFYLTAHIPDSAEISGIASAVTESYGYITDAALADYALTSDLQIVSGAVDENTQSIGELNTAVGSKANQTDLEEVSGQIEYVSSIVTGKADSSTLEDYALKTDLSDYVPTSDIGNYALTSDLEVVSGAVTGLANDIGYLSSVITGKADSSALEDYALKTDISDFITAEDIPTYTGVSGIGITLVDDVYEVAITGEVGKTYTAGTGIGLDETDGKHEFYLTGTVLTGGDHISIENNVVSLTGDVGKTYSGTETGGIEVDNENNTITLSATIPTTVAELTDASNYALTSDLADYVPTSDISNYALTSDLQVVSGAVTGVVEDIDYLSSVITGKADSSELANYIPTSQLDTLATKDELSSKADSSQLANYALTSDLQLVSAAVTGVASDIDYISSVVTGKADSSVLTDYVTETDLGTTLEDYALKTDLPSDYATTGDIEYLSSVITGKADSSAIPLSTSQLTNDSGYITINDVPPGTLYEAGEGLATSGQNNNIFYLTATIPTDANISGIASAVVEDLSTTIRSGLASTSDIPTTVAELTDSSDYALKSELIDTEDVSGVVEAMSATIIDGLATEGFVTGQGYITNAALADYAQLSDLPSDYITSGQASAIVTGYIDSVSSIIRSGLATTSDISDMATQTWVGQQGFATTSDIPTVGDLSAGMYSAISGDVEDQITGKGYITNAALTNYALKSELPVVSTYVQGTGISITSSDTNQYTVAFDNSQLGYITGYNEGTGIKIDNGEVSLTAAIPSNSDITDIASTVVHNYVVASGLVTGTGLFYDETDNSLNVVLSAANDSNMIVSADNNGVVWLSSVAQGGGGGGATYAAGNGIDLTNNIISVKLSGGSNVTLSTDQNGYIIISSTGGGGGGNIPTDTLDLTNGAGYITLSAISNKQKVYEYSSGNLFAPNGNEITYNRAYEIFKTTYLTEAGYTPLLQLHEVNVPNGSLASNEVATFEEWMYLSGVDVPSSDFGLFPDLELIGELPAILEAGKTHVFVRRIIYGSSTQYVSYAYSF